MLGRDHARSHDTSRGSLAWLDGKVGTRRVLWVPRVVVAEPQSLIRPARPGHDAMIRYWLTERGERSERGRVSPAVGKL